MPRDRLFEDAWIQPVGEEAQPSSSGSFACDLYETADD
jgi:hypothetical protein